MTESTKPALLVETREAIRILRLNQPERRNALSIALRGEIVAALNEAMADAAVRCIVITGGSTFCAGGDLQSMQGINPVAGRRRLEGLHGLARLIATGPKPVVAAVEGFAYGAGMSFALLCDQVVAARDAKFCASFGRIGLMADMAALWTVPQRVSAGWAKRILMLAEEVDGETAGRIGLADHVTEPGGALDAALAVAGRFAAMAPLPLGYTKQMLARGPRSLEAVLGNEADLQAVLFASADFAAGRDAFLAKKKPEFKGE